MEKSPHQKWTITPIFDPDGGVTIPLPDELLNQWGVSIGDSLDLNVKNSGTSDECWVLSKLLKVAKDTTGQTHPDDN